MRRRFLQGLICAAVFGTLAAIVVLWLPPDDGRRLNLIYWKALWILGWLVPIEKLSPWNHHEMVLGIQLVTIALATVSCGLWGMAVGRFKIRFLVPGIALFVIVVAGYPISKGALPNHLQFAPADSNLRKVRFNCVLEFEGWNEVCVLETREPPLETIRLIERKSRERGYSADKKGEVDGSCWTVFCHL